jgi:hypothetical protein
MGADGWLHIFDADAIDAAGLTDKFFKYYASPYVQSIFGKRVYTAYGDTEHHDTYSEGVRNNDVILEKIQEHLIDTWKVWT